MVDIRVWYGVASGMVDIAAVASKSRIITSLPQSFTHSVWAPRFQWLAAQHALWAQSAQSAQPAHHTSGMKAGACAGLGVDLFLMLERYRGLASGQCTFSVYYLPMAHFISASVCVGTHATFRYRTTLCQSKAPIPVAITTQRGVRVHSSRTKYGGPSSFCRPPCLWVPRCCAPASV